jgi:hypothetical protein
MHKENEFTEQNAIKIKSAGNKQVGKEATLELICSKQGDQMNSIKSRPKCSPSIFCKY